MIILQSLYVITKDRLNNTSFAIQHYIMKSYPTYIGQERLPSVPGLFYAFGNKIDIYIW